MVMLSYTVTFDAYLRYNISKTRLPAGRHKTKNQSHETGTAIQHIQKDPQGLTEYVV